MYVSGNTIKPGEKFPAACKTKENCSSDNAEKGRYQFFCHVNELVMLVCVVRRSPDLVPLDHFLGANE